MRLCRSPGGRPAASTVSARSDGAAPGGQGSRARRRFGSPVQLLDRQGARGRRRHEGRTPPRPGLPGTGRSRCWWVRREPVRPLDARLPDPPPHRRRRSRLLLHPVPRRHADRGAGPDRGTSMGHRGWPRDGQDRTRSRPRRDALPAWLAPPRLARHDGLRHARRHPLPSRRCHTLEKGARRQDHAPPSIRRSMQEIRRIPSRLARRRIHPAHLIAWSPWRARASSRRARSPCRIKDATVMLGRMQPRCSCTSYRRAGRRHRAPTPRRHRREGSGCFGSCRTPHDRTIGAIGTEGIIPGEGHHATGLG
jgi:hypothetical protein